MKGKRHATEAEESFVTNRTDQLKSDRFESAIKTMAGIAKNNANARGCCAGTIEIGFCGWTNQWQIQVEMQACETIAYLCHSREVDFKEDLPRIRIKRDTTLPDTAKVTDLIKACVGLGNQLYADDKIITNAIINSNPELKGLKQ